MSYRATDELLNHEYDGIREYDNPTPGWWHMLFMASVGFAVVYMFFFHVSPMSWTIHERWQDAQLAEYRRLFGSIGELEADEQTIQRMRTDEQMLAIARGTFESTCAGCHAKNGSGANNIGANLTDDVYKSVRTLMDVYTVIENGAGMGAMPAWGQRLSQNERVILSAYVANLRGTDVPGGRAPEGEAIPPWPAPTPQAP